MSGPFHTSKTVSSPGAVDRIRFNVGCMETGQVRASLDRMARTEQAPGEKSLGETAEHLTTGFR